MKLKILKEKQVKLLELIGVVMRILAFGTLSIMGPDTPFLAMWIWNTIDAVILTYASWERSNRAYLILNIFWMIVGIVGIYTSIYGNGITH
jgi:TRAP-type mannitol/chloroaromatic compound transport system permease small subunit